jgi:hypothetical protein
MGPLSQVIIMFFGMLHMHGQQGLGEGGICGRVDCVEGQLVQAGSMFDVLLQGDTKHGLSSGCVVIVVRWCELCKAEGIIIVNVWFN